MNFWGYIISFLQHLYVFAGYLSVIFVAVSFLNISLFSPSHNHLRGPFLEWDRYAVMGLDIVFLIDYIIRGTKGIGFNSSNIPDTEIIPMWSALFIFLSLSFLTKLCFATYLTIEGIKFRNRNRLIKKPKVKGAISST